MKPSAYCLHQGVLLLFYNDEFEISLSTFCFEVISNLQKTCKTSTTPVLFHHCSVWPHLLCHSLFLSLLLSLYFQYRLRTWYLILSLNCWMYVFLKQGSSSMYHSKSIKIRTSTCTQHVHLTLKLHSNLFPPPQWCQSQQKSNKHIEPASLLFSFLSDSVFNLGSCMGFSCQICLVSFPLE